MSSYTDNPNSYNSQLRSFLGQGTPAGTPHFNNKPMPNPRPSKDTLTIHSWSSNDRLYISFQGTELPAELTFGGSQKLVTHQLPNGGRVIDIMGYDDMDLEWSGLFSPLSANVGVAYVEILKPGSKPVLADISWIDETGDTIYSPFDRARLLDSLRVKGSPLKISFGGYTYGPVFIAHLELKYKFHTLIGYTIRLRNVVNPGIQLKSQTYPVTQALAAQDARLTGWAKIASQLSNAWQATKYFVSAISSAVTLTIAAIKKVIGEVAGAIQVAISLVQAVASAFTSFAAAVTEITSLCTSFKQQISQILASISTALETYSTFGGLFPPNAQAIANVNAMNTVISNSFTSNASTSSYASTTLISNFANALTSNISVPVSSVTPFSPGSVPGTMKLTSTSMSFTVTAMTTVFQISLQAYGTIAEWPTLMAANNLTDTNIAAGTVLIIPALSLATNGIYVPAGVDLTQASCEAA